MAFGTAAPRCFEEMFFKILLPTFWLGPSGSRESRIVKQRIGISPCNGQSGYTWVLEVADAPRSNLICRWAAV
jgi:hypothetical protein